MLECGGSEIAPRRRPSTSLRTGSGRLLRRSSGCAVMKNSVRGDSSTGSELKAVEEACREAPRTVEPCVLCASAVNTSSQETRNNPKGKGDQGDREQWVVGVMECSTPTTPALQAAGSSTRVRFPGRSGRALCGYRRRASDRCCGDGS